MEGGFKILRMRHKRNTCLCELACFAARAADKHVSCALACRIEFSSEQELDRAACMPTERSARHRLENRIARLPGNFIG